jgi:hypothetical protein
LASECSVIVARGRDGAMVNLPVQRNLHRDGILAVTEVFDGNVPADLAAQAIAATKSIAEGLQYVGVLCVEFFVLQGADRLLVNEIAPRPHNSGHYTIDACDQSQFDLQVRTLAGLPLVPPRQHSPAIMLNLLGDLWQAGTPDWAALLALPGVHLHLYGKLAARPGRKMGHITVAAASGETFLADLEHLGAVADPATGTVEAAFHVPNPKLALRPGMRAEFSIVVATRSEITTVPRSALQGDPATRFVYVKHFDLPNAFIKTPVIVGQTNDQSVEIIRGLFPADEVVTQGAYSLAFVGGGTISLKAALDAESASHTPITPTQNTAPTLSDSLPSAHAPGKVKIVFVLNLFEGEAITHARASAALHKHT